LPLYAKRSGADIVIINVGSTEQDHIADIIIDAPAGKTMTKIVERLRSGDSK
jgi:NAD-dependent deacetylase